MSRVEFLLVLIPLAYMLWGIISFRGLRHQPRVVHAGSGRCFDLAMDRAGGVDEVRRGLRVDAGFIVLWLGVSTYLLRANPAWVLVPCAAAVLDVVESVQLTRLLEGDPRERWIRLLALTGAAKMFAYLFTVGLLLHTCCNLAG